MKYEVLRTIEPSSHLFPRNFSYRKPLKRNSILPMHIRLSSLASVLVSRTLARNIFSGLEQSTTVTVDFENIPSVSHAFADEYRMFKDAHPHMTIMAINMNDVVRGVVESE